MLDGGRDERVHALGLLQDPTIYMYAFFKNDDGDPLKLYPYQDMIINDGNDRVVFAAANQIGKSITLCCKALHYALTNPGKTVMMTSKTLPQSKDLLRQIKRLLQTSNIEYKPIIGDSENKTEIYFRHFNKKGEGDVEELAQSRIICVPATEAALGYAVDLMLMDELAFYEDGEHFYYQIAQPRTYTTKGQIIVFSNPNGQQGVFWKLWNNNRFSKYRFTFLDCPHNTEEEYNQLVEDDELTQEQIDSTLNAVFTNPEGGFFTLQERKAMQEERSNMIPSIIEDPVFIFFDWGKVNDRTVRATGQVVINEGDKKGVHVLELKEYKNQTPYSDIVDDLKDLIQLVGFNKVAMVGWDNKGVGSGIEDFIKKINEMGVNTMPVEFSLENKSRIYTTFKLLAERNLKGQRALKMPKVSECDKQLAQLRFKRSPRGYLKVHHEKESDRDDYPDAIAGLCSLIITPEPPVTLTFV